MLLYDVLILRHIFVLFVPPGVFKENVFWAEPVHHGGCSGVRHSRWTLKRISSGAHDAGGGRLEKIQQIHIIYVYVGNFWVNTNITCAQENKNNTW